MYPKLAPNLLIAQASLELVLIPLCLLYKCCYHRCTPPWLATHFSGEDKLPKDGVRPE